ncbi:hypothetical protein E8E11_004368 [Didymella keratinophila]|nr:hypothetical protein E8E11_004368 [Didymella keratinophila]
MSSLPNFGGQDILAQATKDSGIASLLRFSKKGGAVSDEQLATTVKTLFGAVMEETQDENCVCRAAFCLGLEEVSERAEVVEAFSEPVPDLLAVEEFAFVQCGRVSVPVVESLI